MPKEEPFAKHAVFLLDTSLSEGSDRFAVSMRLMQKVLEGDPGIEHFNVLAFNAGAAWVEPKGWLANTRAGRESAWPASTASCWKAPPTCPPRWTSSSSPASTRQQDAAGLLPALGRAPDLGPDRGRPLVARFRERCANPARFFCYRTGLGQENAELFDALTRDGGGVFQCFGEAEVDAAGGAPPAVPEVERVSFSGGGEVGEVIVAGRRSAVYPGGELVVVGQARQGRPQEGGRRGPLPGPAVLADLRRRRPARRRAGGPRLGRGGGRVAAVAGRPVDCDDLVTAYCQEFGVASRAASFLVLENDAEYKRFGLDEEKGRTVKGDLGALPRRRLAGARRASPRPRPRSAGCST